MCFLKFIENLKFFDVFEKKLVLKICIIFFVFFLEIINIYFMCIKYIENIL